MAPLSLNVWITRIGREGRTLEKIKNKTANVEVVEGGSYYDIPLGYTKEIYSEIGLSFPESYLEGVLRKYYSR